jgi:hypothetical protein
MARLGIDNLGVVAAANQTGAGIMGLGAANGTEGYHGSEYGIADHGLSPGLYGGLLASLLTGISPSFRRKANAHTGSDPFMPWMAVLMHPAAAAAYGPADSAPTAPVPQRPLSTTDVSQIGDLYIFREYAADDSANLGY